MWLPGPRALMQLWSLCGSSELVSALPLSEQQHCCSLIPHLPCSQAEPKEEQVKIKAEPFTGASLATKTIPARVSHKGRPLLGAATFPGALPSRRSRVCSGRGGRAGGV